MATKATLPPGMNPREQLTRKARLAIQTYVTWHGDKHGQFVFMLITWTLQAERMKRSQLYQWCQEHGYRWNSKSGWTKVSRKLIRE